MKEKLPVIRRKIYVVVLAFLGTLFVPQLMRGVRQPVCYSTSILSFLIFALLYYFLRMTDRQKYLYWKTQPAKQWAIPILLGTSLSICMIFGVWLEEKGFVPFSQLTMWFAILVFSVIFSEFCRLLFDKMALVIDHKKEKTEEETTKKLRRTRFLKTAALIFICYLPVFLAVFPGFFVYDAQDEYLQVVTRNFSTHHPLVHVLLLGGIIQLVYKLTASYNLGIAVYTLLQMLILSGVFSYCIQKLRNRGLSKGKGILLALYFGICPVLVMFSLCSAKDGLFTGALLLTVLLMQELCQDTEAFFAKKGKKIGLALSLLAICLLRHNGFCAFLVAIPIITLLLKKFWKKLLPYFLGVVVVYVLLNGLLIGALHADTSENQELLTVPIMQLSRVYTYEKNTMTLQEKQTLTRFIPENALMRYSAKVSDGVKIAFDNEEYEKDKGGFLRLWLQVGLKHPFSYLNAWYMTSYGFWYPDASMDVYRGNTVFTFTYRASSYFGYEVEQPGVRKSFIPFLDELYRRMSLEVFQQKLPVVSMLFSPGFMLWLFLWQLGFLIYQKRTREVLPYVLSLLIFLTVLLGPTYLVRYVVFLWAVNPVLLFGLFDY